MNFNAIICPRCGNATTLDKICECQKHFELTPEESIKIHREINKHLQDIGEYIPIFNKEKQMQVHLLECWTHAMYPGPDGHAHDTYNVGIFSSKEEALEYAKSKPTYAGNEDNWDWVITPYKLNEDNEFCGMPVHYTRHGELVEDPASYTPDMEDDEEDEDPVIVKDGTVSVSQPVNTQEDVDEFIERLQKLKPNLPLRKEPDAQELFMRVIDAMGELAKKLNK